MMRGGAWQVLTTAAHTYTFMTGTSAEAVSWETHFLGMISSVNVCR
jgi:hypothetical protein